MPYITKEQQAKADLSCFHINPNDSGELNYVLTLICLNYVNHRGHRYSTMNDIIGALEGCKMEFYRRLVAPYEDVKVKENGDVY
jgi:hypothetical protein